MLSLSAPMLAVVGAVGGMAILTAGVQSWRAERLDDQVVTLRLGEKDLQAKIFNLNRDVADRDSRILARASAEADDRGQADRSCATDLSAAFQKGVAVGRAIPHATTPDPDGQRPAAGGLRDYREAWSAGAFRPAS